MIEQKSIGTIDKFLGQFMTPPNITDNIVDKDENEEKEDDTRA